ncbi:hypothetical protein KCU73_g9184, partial [Aureobasidium melanogenum]
GRLDLQNWIPVMPNADSVPRFCGSSMTRRSSTRISTWLLLRRLTENRTTARKDIRKSCDEVHRSIKESRQDIMESYEEINRSIQSFRDAILEAYATPQDIRESCDETKQSIKQSHDAILEAQKLRKRAGDHDIRATSALHRRKPSWQGSIGSVKTFTQRCGSKGREVFRSATKSAHPRSASEGVLPLQRTFFQHGASTRLLEQNAVDTMAERLLGQDHQSSRHKAYIQSFPTARTDSASALKTTKSQQRSVSHRKKSSWQASADPAKIVTRRMFGKSKEVIGVVAEKATHRSRVSDPSINTDISSIHTATVNYSLSSLCLWKTSFIIKYYTGNTTTVIQHTRDVIGVVINEDTDGCVANAGDLLFDVHFATVGKDRRVMVSTRPPSVKRAHAQGSRYR